MDQKEMKKDNQDKSDSEAFYYGPWTWIGGLAFGGFIIFILFALSDSIS